jgi:hypothetical protein
MASSLMHGAISSGIQVLFSSDLALSKRDFKSGISPLYSFSKKKKKKKRQEANPS